MRIKFRPLNPAIFCATGALSSGNDVAPPLLVRFAPKLWCVRSSSFCQVSGGEVLSIYRSVSIFRGRVKCFDFTPIAHYIFIVPVLCKRYFSWRILCSGKRHDFSSIRKAAATRATVVKNFVTKART